MIEMNKACRELENLLGISNSQQSQKSSRLAESWSSSYSNSTRVVLKYDEQPSISESFSMDEDATQLVTQSHASKRSTQPQKNSSSLRIRSVSRKKSLIKHRTSSKNIRVVDSQLTQLPPHASPPKTTHSLSFLTRQLKIMASCTSNRRNLNQHNARKKRF